ncbi:MAG: HepT-like ribonuclease domain-containing protein [Bryobacteraceae bacterium]
MKDDRLYLHHMLERCRRISRFIRTGRASFMAAEELQDAVIRNIEVIGEAAKRVSPGTREQLIRPGLEEDLRDAGRSDPRLHRTAARNTALIFARYILLWISCPIVDWIFWACKMPDYI